MAIVETAARGELPESGLRRGEIDPALVDCGWGVVLLDVTDGGRPEPEVLEEEGWLLVCYGGHPGKPCQIARDTTKRPDDHGVVVEFDPGRESHRDFLVRLRELLRPAIPLRAVSRG